MILRDPPVPKETTRNRRTTVHCWPSSERLLLFSGLFKWTALLKRQCVAWDSQVRICDPRQGESARFQLQWENVWQSVEPNPKWIFDSFLKQTLSTTLNELIAKTIRTVTKSARNALSTKRNQQFKLLCKILLLQDAVTAICIDLVRRTCWFRNLQSPKLGGYFGRLVSIDCDL